MEASTHTSSDPANPITLGAHAMEERLKTFSEALAPLVLHWNEKLLPNSVIDAAKDIDAINVSRLAIAAKLSGFATEFLAAWDILRKLAPDKIIEFNQGLESAYSSKGDKLVALANLAKANEVDFTYDQLSIAQLKALEQCFYCVFLDVIPGIAKTSVRQYSELELAGIATLTMEMFSVPKESITKGRPLEVVGSYSPFFREIEPGYLTNSALATVYSDYLKDGTEGVARSLTGIAQRALLAVRIEDLFAGLSTCRGYDQSQDQGLKDRLNLLVETDPQKAEKLLGMRGADKLFQLLQVNGKAITNDQLNTLLKNDKNSADHMPILLGVVTQLLYLNGRTWPTEFIELSCDKQRKQLFEYFGVAPRDNFDIDQLLSIYISRKRQGASHTFSTDYATVPAHGTWADFPGMETIKSIDLSNILRLAKLKLRT